MDYYYILTSLGHDAINHNIEIPSGQKLVLILNKLLTVLMINV